MVNFTTDSFPSCCVWSWTLSKSRGCVQQQAIAEATPPKYHFDNFCSFDILQVLHTYETENQTKMKLLMHT